MTSKATSDNLKDLFGSVKPSISKIPSTAILHCSHALMDGANKYGAYNWRDKKVISSIYYDAAIRHVMSWFEGEEFAEDSNCSHLGHAMACLAILIDATETDNLIDDRPNGKFIASKLIKEITQKIKDKNKNVD